jgi:hypothetical protein
MFESRRARGGMIPKQASFILAKLGNRADSRAFRLDEGNTDMKTKLGSTVLLSLMYVQGFLGMAAVASVLMKEPAKEHHGPAQSAAVEGLVSVR